mmetsp:Transcript_38123/g.120391  ORF Transcript_38123/g.120391 Transcript_38123/m.120391 type:complete len:208 (-) Transcript_38123:1363-1986(-)
MPPIRAWTLSRRRWRRGAPAEPGPGAPPPSRLWTRFERPRRTTCRRGRNCTTRRGFCARVRPPLSARASTSPTAAETRRAWPAASCARTTAVGAATAGATAPLQDMPRSSSPTLNGRVCQSASSGARHSSSASRASPSSLRWNKPGALPGAKTVACVARTLSTTGWRRGAPGRTPRSWLLGHRMSPRGGMHGSARLSPPPRASVPYF